MRLNSMGINIEHEESFFIDRPVGLGDNLLLVFRSDARIWYEKSWNYVTSGSFIVYRKGEEQKYGACGGKYINHYIHFDAEDESFFDKIGLWTGRAGYLQNIDEVETLFRLLSREQISSSAYHTENESLLIELITRKIAENECEKTDSKTDVRHLEELTKLRSEMYSTPGKYSNISDMASAVNLSLSHFQALYKEYFAISCYEDLLNARINGAKGFLINSGLSVREIANLCGYDSDTCFMRCFKSRVGVTPTEYRKGEY